MFFTWAVYLGDQTNGVDHGQGLSKSLMITMDGSPRTEIAASGGS